MNAAAVRRLALALPDVEEQPHHGFPSFRVRGKIFATLRDPGFVNVLLDPAEAPAAAALAGHAVEELYWGEKLAGVRVDLGKADAKLVRRLLADAHRYKSPAPNRKPARASRSSG